MGNDARAEEFFERARKALEDLLEVNDYAVAEALFALGYYLYGRVSHPSLSTLARAFSTSPTHSSSLLCATPSIVSCAMSCEGRSRSILLLHHPGQADLSADRVPASSAAHPYLVRAC
jgi:hypothetical protein